MYNDFDIKEVCCPVTLLLSSLHAIGNKLVPKLCIFVYQESTLLLYFFVLLQWKQPWRWLYYSDKRKTITILHVFFIAYCLARIFHLAWNTSFWLDPTVFLFFSYILHSESDQPQPSLLFCHSTVDTPFLLTSLAHSNLHFAALPWRRSCHPPAASLRWCHRPVPVWSPP